MHNNETVACSHWCRPPKKPYRGLKSTTACRLRIPAAASCSSWRFGASKCTSVVPSLKRRDASGAAARLPLPTFIRTLLSPGGKNNARCFFRHLVCLRVAAANADAINVRAMVAWSDEYKSKQQKLKVATSRTKLSFFGKRFNIKAAFYLFEQQRKMSTSLLRNCCVALGRCWHSCFSMLPLRSFFYFFPEDAHSSRYYFRHRGPGFTSKAEQCK